MQYAPNMTLYKYISKRHLSELATIYYANQLIDALHCMNTQNLAHRDLKPENFLIDHQFDLLLADFGFCTEILHEINGVKTKMHTSCRGTLGYMAPEILDQAILYTNGYNPEQTDIFSLGVILFSMYLGKPPFRQANPRKCELYKLISEFKFSDFWELWEQKWAV
jgi:serine/threonine protein kinase